MTAEPLRLRSDSAGIAADPSRVDLMPARARLRPVASSGASADKPVGISEVSSFLRASWKPAALLASVSAALAIAYCVTTTPAFTASAQILIEADRTQSYFQDTTRAEPPNETGRVESQIEIVKSDRTAQAVIRKLNLLVDPEFAPGPPKPSMLSWIPGLGSTPVELSPVEADIVRMSAVVNSFGSRLGVRRIGQSYVVEIQFKSRDPAKAAAITDGILAAYIDGDVQAKAENARRGNQWLSERLTEVRSQVSASRRAVEHFKTGSEMGNLGERYVKLAELESVAQSQSKLYDTFLQRYIETAQRITFPVPDARIIAPAARPLARSHPKTPLIVAFATLFGGALGVGVAALRRSADPSVRSSHKAAAQAGATTLCEMPTLKGRRGRRGIPVLPADMLAGAAFEVKTLKACLNTELLGQRGRIVGVTSCSAGAGKSTVAAALATAYAQAGARTLLVDACADNPAITRAFAPEARFGLAQIVEHVDMVNRLVVPQAGTDNLFVMALGEVTTIAPPAESIASTKPRAVIGGITAGFDMVIVDLPALDVSADARALGPFLSGLVLVVEYGRTRMDDLARAAESLDDGYSTVLGLVLNKTKRRARA